MIKKNTKAIFEDGDYKGEYDWQGGIPLSEGEVMKVNLNGETLNYVLVNKEIICNVEGEDQIVNVTYYFKIK